MEQLFARIGWMVHARSGPTPSEIASHLMKREQRGSTALGHGIALPHAHVTGLRRPVAAFVRTRAPISMITPDARPVSEVFALVVPKPGMQPTAEDIMAFCRQHMAHFKCPKAVEFGDLPKTSTGKIKKFELREKEWQGYEKRIH